MADGFTGFYMPAWIAKLSSPITGEHKIALALLLHHQGANESAFPSRETLGAEMGRSARAAFNRVLDLEAWGFVQRVAASRGRRSVHYRVTASAETAAALARSAAAAGDRRAPSRPRVQPGARAPGSPAVNPDDGVRVEPGGRGPGSPGVNPDDGVRVEPGGRGPGSPGVNPDDGVRLNPDDGVRLNPDDGVRRNDHGKDHLKRSDAGSETGRAGPRASARPEPSTSTAATHPEPTGEHPNAPEGVTGPSGFALEAQRGPTPHDVDAARMRDLLEGALGRAGAAVGPMVDGDLAAIAVAIRRRATALDPERDLRDDVLALYVEHVRTDLARRPASSGDLRERIDRLLATALAHRELRRVRVEHDARRRGRHAAPPEPDEEPIEAGTVDEDLRDHGDRAAFLWREWTRRYVRHRGGQYPSDAHGDAKAKVVAALAANALSAGRPYAELTTEVLERYWSQDWPKAPENRPSLANLLRWLDDLVGDVRAGRTGRKAPSSVGPMPAAWSGHSVPDDPIDQPPNIADLLRRGAPREDLDAELRRAAGERT